MKVYSLVHYKDEHPKWWQFAWNIFAQIVTGLKHYWNWWVYPSVSYMWGYYFGKWPR